MTNASSSKMSVEEMIGHYQRSIERSQHDPKRILHCIGKLSRMNITVQHLTSTGIGRTVNGLRKDDGEIGSAAKALISRWKQMVASQESDGEDGNTQGEYHYENDESGKMQTESISNNERKSHKAHDHISRSGSSNSNHQHHRDPHQSHEQGKIVDSHSNNRKYSSDDTQEHLIHSKHKHKSHSRDDASSMSRKHEHDQENISGASDDQHKSSSKHSKEDRHHRSRHDTQHNGEENSDRKHRNESKDPKDHSKHSSHHKSHSSSNEKSHTSSKHKRARESDDSASAPKKHKSDSSNATSSRSEEKKSSSKSKFRHSDDGIEIDHSMGTSFADALGMLAPKPTTSKSDKTSVAATSSKLPNKTSTLSSSSSSISSISSKSKIKEKSKPSTSKATATPSLLLKKPKLPPLEDLTKDLPPPVECIIPNDYKPSPINPMVMECIFKGPKPVSAQTPMLSETAALCASTTSKNQRTKVYSGVKSGVLLTVPSLHELCIRFLQKNIDALEYTGGVPFEILRPILERATPEQLNLFEHYNPYLMDDSDVLWQQHCQRKFKAFKRQEMETWREMFLRCTNEQEARLNSLTNNIKKSQSVAVPVRKTMFAFDNMVKPPRNVMKKQNQFGTHNKLTATPAARIEALSAVASNIARPGDARLKTLASMRDTAQAQPSSNGAMKPKKAPLMAKTLQLMKGRFKR